MKTANFLEDILRAVGDEEIEKIVLLSEKLDSPGWGEKSRDDYVPSEFIGKIKNFSEVREMLNYQYAGYTYKLDMHEFLLWTNKSIWFLDIKSGSYSLKKIPRNPENYSKNN